MSAKETKESPAPERRRQYLPWTAGTVLVAVGIALVIVVVVLFVRPALSRKRGTAGKVQVTLEVKKGDGAVRSGTMADLERVLRLRAEVLGLEEVYVTSKGDHALVAFKPIEELDAAVQVLSTTGDLNVYPVPEEYNPEFTTKQIYLVGPAGERQPAEEVLKKVEPIVKRADLRTKAKVGSAIETNRPKLSIFLETSADRAFDTWYNEHKDAYLAIAFDDKVISIAKVTEPLRRQADIQGIFTREEAKTMADCLNTDPLPVDVRALPPQMP